MLLGLGELKEGIDYAGLIEQLIQVGLLDKVHHQPLFGAVAQAGAHHAAHVFQQRRLVFALLVALKNQRQDVVQIDLLGFEQIHLKHHIAPVDARWVFVSTLLFFAQPVAHVVVGGAVVLHLALRRQGDGLQRLHIRIAQMVLGLKRLHGGGIG